jgi:hypothetical protein
MFDDDRLGRVQAAALWLCSLLVVAQVGWGWARRLRWPYDLEWMEGGMLAHAWWLLQGEPLYGPPNPDFVPFLYPPGYSALLAALGGVVGLSPALGRGVSIAGTLAAAAAIAFIVRRSGATAAVASCSAAVFLGTWPYSGTFMDLVRPDALGLGLLGWSLALALVPGRRAAVGAAVLLIGAYLVKHNLAAFGLPIALALARRDGWRTGAVWALGTAGVALAITAALDASSGGHMLRYLVQVPLSHPTADDLLRLWPHAPRELSTPLPVAWGAVGLWAVATAVGRAERVPRWALATLPVAAGMLLGWWGTYSGGFAPQTLQYRIPAAVGLFALGAVPVAVALGGIDDALSRRGWSWRWVFGASVGAVAVLLALRMRAHIGGFLNVHMPAHWALAVALGVLVGRWQRAELGWLRRLAPVLIVGQLLWLAPLITPGRWVPTEADRAANDAVVERLRGEDGPVLSPWAAWLPTYAGHPPSLHYMGLWDLEYPGGPYLDARDPIFDAVRAKRWPVVLAGNRPFPYDLREHYVVDEELYPEPVEGGPAAQPGMPVVGYPVRPERVLVPRY